MGAISISEGNSKMGAIRSVSLPSILTCRACECQKKCYAHKIERLRKTVSAAYRRNLEVLQTDPATYWREVEASIMMSRFFRFHVSGDIPDVQYFEKMLEVASRNKHCEILCFTKKYEIVNDYLGRGKMIPKNLHIIFSAWVGLKMTNPFSLPEAHVRYRDGSATTDKDAYECAGNCAECATADGGCWTLRQNDRVIFNEH